MIRMRHLLVALAAIAGLVTSSAFAQTPEAGMPPAISELEGIEAGIGRTWSLDYEAIMADAGLLALLMGQPDPPTTTIAIDEPTEGVAARTGSIVITYPIQYRTPLGDPGTKA